MLEHPSIVFAVIGLLSLAAQWLAWRARLPAIVFLLLFGKSIGVGLLSGCVAGYLLGLTLRNSWLPNYLENLATFALVIGVFVLADTLQPESGLLAVTVMSWACRPNRT